VRYPDGPVAAVRQMIDRGGNDDSADPDFLRDWIGTDTRQPGNPMVLTLSGLPADTYTWTSAHHDPENQTGLFDVTVIDSTGSTTTPDIDITDENLVDPNAYTRFITTIVADGSDVIFVFDQQVSTPTELAFFVMNGFDLVGTGDPLKIDFSRPTTPVKTGYQGYLAEHEVEATFTPQTFSAFGTTVMISVDWGPKALGLVNDSVTKTNADLYFPTADFTTDTAGTYVIQLTATDTENPPASDTMEIFVGEDACEAAQEAPGWVEFNFYDRDQNCIVDLLDFAPFALEWLDNRNLPGPVTN